MMREHGAQGHRAWSVSKLETGGRSASFSGMYASPARSTMISGALHGAVIALILLTTGVRTSPVKNTDHVILFTPLDLMKSDVTVPQQDDPGGGGGRSEEHTSELGNLPARKLKQFLAPMVKAENANPILTIEPSIIASPEIR